jgi:hypothetical protein
MDVYKQYHLQAIPDDAPYEGNNYHGVNIPSLMLVGESHYLPEGSSQHVGADTWYEGSSDTLSPLEIGWISTATLMKDARTEGFSNRHTAESGEIRSG